MDFSECDGNSRNRNGTDFPVEFLIRLPGILTRDDDSGAVSLFAATF